jgi:hypothetical protein
MLDNNRLAKDSTHDWRFVKVDQTQFCGEEWVRAAQIESCGVFYLIDANLHVHICSLTPSLEAWPMQGFATFKTEEAAEKDEGNAEMEMLNSEEPATYFDLRVLEGPSQPATKYIDFPEPEEGETDQDYRMRCADEARKVLQGNPVWF